MCKLLIVTRTNKIKNQKKFFNEAMDLVTRQERAGVGYFGMSGNEIHYEKSTDHNMRYGLDAPPYDNSYIEKNYERSQPVKGFKGFTGSVVFHGRTSTNSISLVNTHPIIKHDYFLSHNGVVTNRGESYQTITTNDTEHIIEHLAKRGLKYMSENITGYYAVGTITNDKKLMVFRDNIAPLYCGYVKEIDAEIFATAADHIEAICEEMKYKVSRVYKMKPDTVLTFDAVTGNFQSCSAFESRGYSYTESRHSHLSLGHSLNTPTTTVTETTSTATDTKENKTASNVSAVLAEVKKPTTPTQPNLFSVAKALDKNKTHIDLDEPEKQFLKFASTLPKEFEIYDANYQQLTKEQYRKLGLLDKLNCTFYDDTNKAYDLDWFYRDGNTEEVSLYTTAHDLTQYSGGY